MGEFDEYPDIPDEQGPEHSEARVGFIASGGMIAVGIAGAFHANFYEDAVAFLIGAGVTTRLQPAIDRLRVSFYYWTCDKLGTEPNPEELE